MADPLPSRALVIDVDGVVSPIHGWTAWGDDACGYPWSAEALEASRPEEGKNWEVPVSPTLNSQLDQLAGLHGVTARWLTSWTTEMRLGMNFPGTGWHSLEDELSGDRERRFDYLDRFATDPRFGDGSWWKWWTLVAWLDEHPEVDAVVWCDDDLWRPFCDVIAPPPRSNPEQLSAMLSWAAYAIEECRRRGVRLLTVCPDSAVGLTPEHVELIRSFFRAPETAPTPTRPPALLPVSPAEHPLMVDDLMVCARCDDRLWYREYFLWNYQCPRCVRVWTPPPESDAITW